MRKGGVDVYLAGEVHDVTATTRDGILQLAHGGAFQFGLTTYAQLDISDDHLVVTLNDYRSRSRDAANGTRLWETERRGIKKVFELAPRAFTIGTLTLDAHGAVRPHRHPVAVAGLWKRRTSAGPRPVTCPRNATDILWW